MPKSKKAVAPKKLKKSITSKEQKAQEQEIKRQRILVKDVVFPFLIANTKNVTEAKRLCYEVSQILTQSFQKKVAEEQKRLSEGLTVDIPFEDIIQKGAGFKVDKALMALFANEKLNITNGILSGMSQAIDSFINEEMAGRSLSTLKTTFL